MPRHSFRQRRNDTAPSTNVVYGLNPVREVVARSPRMIATLYVARALRAAESLVVEARRLGIPVESAESEALDRMSGGGNHQGVVARTKPFEFQAIEDVMAAMPSLVVVLDGITDPQNVGAIIRSAEVLGAGALVLPKDRSAAISATVVRASSGAAVHLPVVQVVNVARALEQLKASGYWIVGLDAAGTSRFRELPPLERAAIVIGGEGKGIRPLVAKSCDFMVAIPVRGRVASLNAAAAAAIGVHELANRVNLGVGAPAGSDRPPPDPGRC
jgi:23S rRNA (guanosine2251-2'-O)-methyltransferase